MLPYERLHDYMWIKENNHHTSCFKIGVWQFNNYNVDKRSINYYSQIAYFGSGPLDLILRWIYSNDTKKYLLMASRHESKAKKEIIHEVDSIGDVMGFCLHQCQTLDTLISTYNDITNNQS